ncbi:MAG: ectonucleotide pyrophosphatase/phosphodiesterase [Oscillibacter sp.]|nr:ectonucleotide pyrophosphatase/phosphodiesterase [Oscillibacter sp.]
MPKLLVFCIDALCASDISLMRDMPHFGHLLRTGALVEKIDPVFPALTYSCHTSILTGTYAGRHGILHNEILTRGGVSGAPWHCMKSDVRGETLLDTARARGLTTCSLSWPVSGGADYDLNMPMIVPYSYRGYEPEKWLRGTATDYLMERYFYKHSRYLKGPGRSLDLFTMSLALDILEKEQQPDVMLVKMCDLDSARHTWGVYAPQTRDQLRMHDEQLGALMECLRRKGTLDDTNIVVLGDHGQTDIQDVCMMNVLFKQKGLLKADHNGTVTSFDAFCHSTGLAALVEVRDPSDKALLQRVRDLLESLRDDPKIRLDLVLDAKQAEERYGLAGPFDFAIESALPIAFGEAAGGDAIWASCLPGDKKMGAATHGGSPMREEVTTFFAAGPNLRPTVVGGHRSMVDEAPTMAAMLGLTMHHIDGTPIFEILR